MTMRILPVLLAACMMTVLPIVAQTGQAKQCSTARPSDPHGHWWSWRLIDGRKCWYEGRAQISKSLLQWSEPSPAKRETAALPVSMLKQKPKELLDSRASLPPDTDSFESLWRARALND
jgi:hypothetical protein